MRRIESFDGDPTLARAYERLLADVFAFAPVRPPAPDPAWTVLVAVEGDGTCVAGVELGRLALLLDGVRADAMAIRLAGVAPSHRGRGLFRDLMDHALALAETRAPGAPTLLYTESAALYERFGFAPVDQHSFVGGPPAAEARAPARVLERDAALALVDRLAARRTPVSQHCALCGASDLLRAGLADPDLCLAAIDAPDALLIFEMDDRELTVVDIVARDMPTMAQIVGALRSGERRVRALFPPDRLAWHGAPEPDQTGLMLRGRIPAAMRRPFMLPPTTSF